MNLFCLNDYYKKRVIDILKNLYIKIKNFFEIRYSYKLTYKNISFINKLFIDKKIKNFKYKNKYIVENMVLSMTSYPERMPDIHYAIFSILNQTIQPKRFILWLANEEFPNKEKDIPKTVLQFKKYGLKIKFTDAIRSFKKIIPALEEFPEYILVSADDDIYYQKNWLKNLYDSYKQDPTKIYAHRIHRVAIKDGEILPYSLWEKCIKTSTPSNLNFPTSVGGILYPPNIFSNEAIKKEVFFHLCPNQDDVWVWAMAILNDKKYINPKNPINNNLIYINYKRELCLNKQTTLGQINNLKGGNDLQIKKIVDHYNLLRKINDIKH